VVESQIVVATEKDHFLAVFPDMCAHLLVKVVVVGLIFQPQLGGFILATATGDAVSLLNKF